MGIITYVFLLLILTTVCASKVVIKSETGNLPPVEHALNSIIRQEGLDVLCRLVGPAIPQMLYESGIPDIVGEANGLKYSMTNFAFSYVDLPGIFASFVDGIGISAGCNNASITLGFDYYFEYTGYPHFELRGSGGLISINDMTIAVVCSITSTEDNKEILSVVAESLNISDMKIEIGSSSFINIILSIMNPIIKNILEEVIGQVVGGIIETLINPSIGKAVIVSMNNQRKLSNGLYQNIFIDKRLVGNPVFENSSMNVQTDARWFIGTYSDPNNISDTTVTWDGVTVKYNSDVELPSRGTNKQFETIVRTDSWASLWDSYIRYGYFIGDATNPNVEIKVNCKNYFESEEECYNTVPVTPTFISRVLPNFDILYPTSDYDVNFSYNLNDNLSLTHEAYYTGIKVGFKGSACLRVKPKVDTSNNWTEILCVSGLLELSEIPSLIPGTPDIQMDYYFHDMVLEDVECPMCESARWSDTDVYIAVVSYINLGVVPFLKSWSRDTALVTNIFDGLYLSDTETYFDSMLGSVSIGGNLEE